MIDTDYDMNNNRSFEDCDFDFMICDSLPENLSNPSLIRILLSSCKNRRLSIGWPRNNDTLSILRISFLIFDVFTWIFYQKIAHSILYKQYVNSFPIAENDRYITDDVTASEIVNFPRRKTGFFQILRVSHRVIEITELLIRKSMKFYIWYLCQLNFYT